MLRLRPYHIKDAETILSWAKDEKAFYKWTAGETHSYENQESGRKVYSRYRGQQGAFPAKQRAESDTDSG